MNRTKEMVTGRDVLVLDGAMGTMLMNSGLAQGDPPEEWNRRHPERIRAIHRAYIQAGAQIILTNSFGGSRYRLQLHDLQGQALELNRAAAALAQLEAEAADHEVLVAGSMGPTGEILEPVGDLVYTEAVAAFAEQATGLAEGGADLLWIETMSDLEEVNAAVAGARSACDLPIAATMTFDTHGHTMMGISPTQAVKSLAALDLVAVGANCGTGPGEIEGVIRAMHAANPALILIAKANAGLPQWGAEGLIYDGTPPVMARYARRVRALGAHLIGACCGSTPEHIQAMAAAVRSPYVGDAEVDGTASVEAPAQVEDRRSTRRRQRRTR